MLTLSEVLPHFGGKKTELADALGITKQAVSQWKGDEVPVVYELRLRYELLPDVFGSRVSA